MEKSKMVIITYAISHTSRDYDKLTRCAEDTVGPMTYYDWTRSEIIYFSLKEESLKFLVT